MEDINFTTSYEYVPPPSLPPSLSPPQLKVCEKELRQLEQAVECASDPSRIRQLPGENPSLNELRDKIETLEVHVPSTVTADATTVAGECSTGVRGRESHTMLCLLAILSSSLPPFLPPSLPPSLPHCSPS